MSNRVSVFRKEHFNAAHRLFNPQWDDEANEKVFENVHYHIITDTIMNWL
jgi:6-pyruvoyltetrahydropterin/6-carboxytetrahydropterin synthase